MPNITLNQPENLDENLDIQEVAKIAVTNSEKHKRRRRDGRFMGLHNGRESSHPRPVWRQRQKGIRRQTCP